MLNAAILSSSSLVVVPDLFGMTPSQAIAALSAAEILVGSTSTTSSGATSGNNGLIASQSVAAGSLVERYSSVGYATYYYVDPTPTTTPTPTPTYGIWISGCSGGSGSRTFLDSTWTCESATAYLQGSGYTNISCAAGYENSPTVSIPSCSTTTTTTPTPTEPPPTTTSAPSCTPGSYCVGYCARIDVASDCSSTEIVDCSFCP